MTVPEDVTTDRTVVSYQAGTYMFPRAGSSYTADDFFTTDIQQVNFTISVIRADGMCCITCNYLYICG